MTPRRALVTTLLALSLLSQGAAGQFSGPSSVRVDPATRTEVQQRRMITGELRPIHRSKVAAPEPGQVVEITVREGARVSRGDLLARLDSRRLDIQLRQLEADLSVIDALRDERQAAVDQRVRDLSLLEASFDRGAANEREVSDARSILGMAKARRAQAQGQHTLTQARADFLRERLDDMSITAPFDGVVVARHVELGEWVGEGEAVVEVLSTGPVEVWLNVPQRYLGPVRDLHLPVEVQVDATGASLDTSEIRVIPDVDARARTFTLIARLENADGRLTSGMSVKAWVPTGQLSEELTVARDSVLRNDSGAFVYVARDAGEGGHVATPVFVEVLFAHGERFVVRSMQLKAGDLVIVEGNERLFPHTPVAPLVADLRESE